MYNYKLEYDFDCGLAIAITFYFENKEIVFQKVKKLQDGVEIETVEIVSVVIYGKVVSENEEDFWIPKKIYSRMKQFAIQKLILVKENKEKEFVCPNCGYLDPQVAELIEAGRAEDMMGCGHTCPNCNKTYVIGSSRPLYWHQKKSKKNI